MENGTLRLYAYADDLGIISIEPGGDAGTYV